MTHEQQALWHRIRDFQIDAPEASHPFSARLARENGWTPVHTERVVEEYRRFAFLAVAAGHGVTPSKAVDEAWHLHLLYTRNYWEGFCPQALGQRLHHNPSGGDPEDDAKYAGWYEATLDSYARLFGEPPPKDIWNPSVPPAKREQDAKGLRRWAFARHPWVFLALPFLLGGCEEPTNPLDWHGPAFLGLFAVLYALAGTVALALRQRALGTDDGPPATDWRLDLYEQAALNEGGGLALATALADLHAKGALEVEPKKGRIKATPTPPAAPKPLERAALRAAEDPKGVAYDAIRVRAQPILADMESDLRKRGLWVREEALPAATLLPFAVMALPLLLGIAKISVGLGRERPVGYLVLGCVLGGLLSLAFLIPPKRSRYGDRVLGELRQGRTGSSDLALGVALFGLAALQGTPYAHLRTAFVPASSGTDGGSGCGGSSCGGGGCGGGGCGGCGS